MTIDEAIYGDHTGLLEIVVEHLERHDGADIGEPVFKSRLLTDEDVDKWEAYKAIGTPDECRAAVEKQKPKKPVMDGYCGFESYECHTCHHDISNEQKYCDKCGQKLGDDEE